MKIIHCSDIHLDSKMDANLSPEKARERNREIAMTFGRMADFAVENGVRAVMICGDLFDTARVTGSTADYILSAMERSAGVDFLYLRGNHDESRRAFAGRELPKNLKLFSDQWTYYDYGPVRIAGVEPGRDGWEDIYDTLNLPAQGTNIVMLHAQISSQPGEDLVCLPRLRGKNIRYLALGHLHSYQEGRLDLDGRYAYCGCLEGRGFDECGQKGFVLLDADEKRVESRSIPFAARELYEISVDITNLHTVAQFQDALRAAGADIDPKDLVKFTLTGTYGPDTRKDLAFLTDMLKDSFYFVKIKDESRLAIDRRSYENDVSLNGEFIRLVMASDRPHEEKERIIAMGIQALSGEEVLL